MRRQWIFVWAAWLAAAWLPLTARAQDGQEKEFIATIDRLMPGMGAEKIEDRKDAQMEFEHLCMVNSGPDKPAERAALCKAIMARVGEGVAKPARIWLLRKVEPIGREEVVTGLAALLHDSDADIRETARRALENNPVPEAGEVLRTELNKAQDAEWKIAIIDALAFRKDEASVDALAKLADDGDAAVADAAVTALGQVADDAAIEGLNKLVGSARPELQPRVSEALLRSGEALIARGEKARAVKIYDKLMAPSQPEQVRLAALLGIVYAKKVNAVPMLLQLIAGDDVHMRLTAARAAQTIRHAEATKLMAAALDGATPQTQVLLLDVLGQRGDAGALPAAVKLIGSSSEEVRIAAIDAIRYLGDGSTVMLLAERAAKSTGDEQAAANLALARLRGDDIDATILKAAPEANGNVRGALLKAAAARRMASAMPLLYEAATDADESIRTAAMYALGDLAPASDLEKVAGVLGKARGEATLKAAEEAVGDVCMRDGDAGRRVKPIIAMMDSARPEVQAACVRVLARAGGDEALGAIRAASKSDAAVVRDAAQAAMKKWPPTYCTAWVFSGPYRQEGKSGADLFDVAFDPEKAGSSVKWKPIAGRKNRPGVFDLQQVAKGDNCVGYVKTSIFSPAAQDAVLTFGSDDGVKAWLNGQVVHGNNATRGFSPDQDQVNVKLKEGWNSLLVKVTQGGADWAIACGLRAADGAPLEGVKFEAK